MPSSSDGNLFTPYHALNPALNVHCFNNNILTDKIYSYTLALDGGHTEAQFFFRYKIHIIHIEPITPKHNFLCALQDFVYEWGAPNCLLSDHAGGQ